MQDSNMVKKYMDAYGVKDLKSLDESELLPDISSSDKSSTQRVFLDRTLKTMLEVRGSISRTSSTTRLSSKKFMKLIIPTNFHQNRFEKHRVWFFCTKTFKWKF